MRPAFVPVILCALGDLARAEDVSSSDDAAMLHAVLDAVTSRDAQAFAELAAREVQLSFLWFDTPTCAKLFSGDGVVLEAGNRAAFLQCLATLDPHLEQHGTPAKAYVEYEPGVALRITARNGVLASIAALASADGDPTAAPVSTHALVAHRTAGPGKVVPDAAVRTAIAAAADAVAFAALLVCVDSSGKLESSVTVRRSPGYDSYVHAAEAAVAQWKFKPFVAHGKPVRACGPTLFVYPQDRWQRTLPSLAPVPAPGSEQH